MGVGSDSPPAFGSAPPQAVTSTHKTAAPARLHRRAVLEAPTARRIRPSKRSFPPCPNRSMMLPLPLARSRCATLDGRRPEQERGQWPLSSTTPLVASSSVPCAPTLRREAHERGHRTLSSPHVHVRSSGKQGRLTDSRRPRRSPTSSASRSSSSIFRQASRCVRHRAHGRRRTASPRNFPRHRDNSRAARRATPSLKPGVAHSHSPTYGSERSSSCAERPRWCSLSTG